MPAGGPHGQLLGYFMEIMRDFLEARNLMLLMDVFMLYRGSRGIKRRIGPDILLMPHRPTVPYAYDLDIDPPPACIGEITSPDSRLKDLEKKVGFYLNLNIPAYFVIDSIRPGRKLRDSINLYLWRKTGGRIRQEPPDADGYLPLPEMHVKLKASGRRLILVDYATDEILPDAGRHRQLTEMERKRAETAEAKMREMAEKLRSMGIDPDAIG